MKPTILLSIAVTIAASGCLSRSRVDPSEWTAEFPVADSDFVTIGRNPYFVLEPGYTLELSDGDDRLVITVMPETQRVGNIETRVVEEREWEDGQLVEVSRNFFAISKRDNGVYYFGETVAIYEQGRVVKHEGEWLAGRNGARFGLLMPGVPLIGGRHYQEIAPGVALDRAEIISINDSLTVPAGAMRNVLKVRETTPLEPGTSEYKYYAREIGLLQDGSLKLTRHGKR